MNAGDLLDQVGFLCDVGEPEVGHGHVEVGAVDLDAEAESLQDRRRRLLVDRLAEKARNPLTAQLDPGLGQRKIRLLRQLRHHL